MSATVRFVEKVIRKSCEKNGLSEYLDKQVSEMPDYFKKDLIQQDASLYQSCVDNKNALIDLFRLSIQKTFDISHGKGPVKYLKGITRLCCDAFNMFGNNPDTYELLNFKQQIMFLYHNQENAVVNGIDGNLNNMSYEEFKNLIKPEQDKENQRNREKLSNIEVKSTEKKYKVIEITSPEQAQVYGKYTTWCITQPSTSVSNWNNYCGKVNRFYFCLQEGFENIKKDSNSTTAPLDEYGLSMISVLVDMEGEPSIITTRYNHEHNGENNDLLFNAEQLQNITGLKFYETFKPYTRDELHAKGVVLFDEVQGLLDSGKDPKEIFDFVDEFKEDVAMVELNNKFNFINTECKLLSDIWFEGVGDFHNNGFAIVKLNNKYNFINTEGKLFDTWFDHVDSFHNGFAQVKLNNKWFKLNAKGELSDVV